VQQRRAALINQPDMAARIWKREAALEDSMSKLLEGKKAVVFGAGGSIGSAVAAELAAEGAEVFLSGRAPANVEKVAQQIRAAGGQAHAKVVDALDERAVDEYISGIIGSAGRIDVVFNAMGPLVSEYANGTHAVDLGTEHFMTPLLTMVKSQFITSRAAARCMTAQRGGVIILLTGSPARGHVEGATAIGTAFGALETFTENLALELGRHGVRAVCLRTMANTDTRAIRETLEFLAAKNGLTLEQAVSGLASLNFLKVPATAVDTARVVAFLASDRARMMTGTVVNASAGSALD
jgi:NAD(P)-dependent dehydrogenase (short-subunit alcohol dehydrogenase family)